MTSWYQRVRHPPSRYAHGGVVHSINSSDSIKVRLSPGEWRLSPDTVKHYGHAYLDRLNSDHSMP